MKLLFAVDSWNMLTQQMRSSINSLQTWNVVAASRLFTSTSTGIESLFEANSGGDLSSENIDHWDKYGRNTTTPSYPAVVVFYLKKDHTYMGFVTKDAISSP